jgi:hypothetical protein
MFELKDAFAVLHEDIELCSGEELKSACKLIIETQGLSSAEVEVLKACFKHGPLFDGDVPSKNAKWELITKGFLVQVVVRGEDGYNACTHKGAQACRLISNGL